MWAETFRKLLGSKAKNAMSWEAKRKLRQAWCGKVPTNALLHTWGYRVQRNCKWFPNRVDDTQARVKRKTP